MAAGKNHIHIVEFLLENVSINEKQEKKKKNDLRFLYLASSQTIETAAGNGMRMINRLMPFTTNERLVVKNKVEVASNYAHIVGGSS